MHLRCLVLELVQALRYVCISRELLDERKKTILFAVMPHAIEAHCVTRRDRRAGFICRCVDNKKWQYRQN